MDEARWEALVRRLEAKARANPAGYRRRVLVLALVGYAFIFGFIAFLLAVAAALLFGGIHGGGLLVLKLLVVLGGLIWVIVRSLHVTFEPPGGVEVRASDAPELFQMLGEVEQAIGAPRPHRVLLDDQANAAIVQIPRASGLFGSENYLVLGLPYLAALTPDELRAVVAHELGHLSRRHGRFGSFVYRVRATWSQLLEALEERRSLWTGAVRRFFAWYVPYFNAYALPAARAHEFEADDAAAQVAGRDAAAASLASGLLAARWVDEAYWPSVYRQADTSESPPAAFAPMATRIGEARTYGNVEAAFQALVEEEAEVTSSHPSLGERLAHLGVEPQAALAAATAAGRPSALDALGASQTRLLDAVEQRWRAGVSSDWRAAHRQALEARQQLARLDRAEARSPEEELERAELTERFEGAEAALPVYRGLVDGPQHAYACFAVGRILLERDDEDGLRWLDRAIAAGPETALSGSSLATEWLMNRRREEEAERYREQAGAAFESFVEAMEERQGVAVDDELEPAGLPEAVMADVREKVRQRSDVIEAYLLRKRLSAMDETHPFYVLAYVLKGGFRAEYRRAKAEDEDFESAADWLSRSIEVPGELMVARISPESPIGRRIVSIEGGLIYRRS